MSVTKPTKTVHSYCRFLADGVAKWGQCTGNTVIELQGDPFTDEGLSTSNHVRQFAMDSIDLLPPCRPTKIICVGVNYLLHLKEMNHDSHQQPVLFLKPPSAIIPHGAAIELPVESSLVHFEGELAVIIGKRCRRITRQMASSVIWGYTCANDVTARDLQRLDGQWTRGKGFDTFLPIGPLVVDELPDGEKTRLTTYLNGHIRQDASIDQMRWHIFDLVTYCSSVMTLEPGDVILTGTPEGVGQLQPGDRIEVDIAGIGRLVNTVR